MRKVLNAVAPVVVVAAAMATLTLPFYVIGGRLDRHDKEISELTEKRLELSRRLADQEEFSRLNWTEQRKINELNHKMHGMAFMRWDRLGSRVERMEKATNIPPQNFPVTPMETTLDD